MSKELTRLRVVSSQATPDELFLTFHVRKNHCADFANPDPDGMVRAPAEPLATLVVGVPLAMRIAKMILSQCAGNKEATEALFKDAFEGLEIRSGGE